MWTCRCISLYYFTGLYTTMQHTLLISWLQLLPYKVYTVNVAITTTSASVGDDSRIFHFNNESNNKMKNNNNNNDDSYSYIAWLSIPWPPYLISYYILMKMRSNPICNVLIMYMIYSLTLWQCNSWLEPSLIAIAYFPDPGAFHASNIPILRSRCALYTSIKLHIPMKQHDWTHIDICAPRSWHCFWYTSIVSYS